jgi:hypothetical protein
MKGVVACSWVAKIVFLVGKKNLLRMHDRVLRDHYLHRKNGHDKVGDAWSA